jgi:uncharacterized protein
MKTCLLDINVLLALGWSHHVHHDLAHEWLAQSPRRPLAHCTLTQLGFIRISLQPAFTPVIASAANLRARLQTFFAAHPTFFLREPEKGIDNLNLASRLDAVLTSAQVTDAYLAGLAHLHQVSVATLDKSFVSRHAAVAELIQV